MRGRKPKPLVRQVAEGDPRKTGKRKLLQRLELEPKATRGLPDCPRYMRGRARHAWNFWREELIAMKLDSRPDAMMLEGACMAYARAIKHELLMAKMGELIEEPVIDREGVLVGKRFRTHPLLGPCNTAWAQCKAFASEFGLSPVSRTRLTLEKPDSGEEDLLKALSQPRERRIGQVQ